MLFQPEINLLEEEIIDYETQIEEAKKQPKTSSVEKQITYCKLKIKKTEEQLNIVKLSQSYADEVISSLQNFLDNTDPSLHETLQNYIEEMFN